MEKPHAEYRWALRVLGIKGDDLDASVLLEAVRDAERKQREIEGIDYTPSRVRQAVVHSREDVVLLVSRLASLNKCAHRIIIRLDILIFIGVAIIVLIWK
jgi:hypothetical protein